MIANDYGKVISGRCPAVLRVAGIAIIIALPLASCWMAACPVSFSGQVVMQAIVTMPLVLPPVVTGYLLLILFSPRAGHWERPCRGGGPFHLLSDGRGPPLLPVSWPFRCWCARSAFR